MSSAKILKRVKYIADCKKFLICLTRKINKESQFLFKIDSNLLRKKVSNNVKIGKKWFKYDLYLSKKRYDFTSKMVQFMFKFGTKCLCLNLFGPLDN